MTTTAIDVHEEIATAKVGPLHPNMGGSNDGSADFFRRL